MDDFKKNVNSPNSPLHRKKGKEIISGVRERCLKRSRQYTLKDLNELRHLNACRVMPGNILTPTEILSQGLGLSIVTTNSFSTTKEVRLKQVQIAKKLDGYKNYVSLIPNKNERIRNVHPMTPTIYEIVNLSKRNFDKKVKFWKKELHYWDAITSISQIPHHLLTNRMLNERNMRSTNYYHNNHRNQAQFMWSPKNPKNLENDDNDHNDYKRENNNDECVTKLIFDDEKNDDQANDNQAQSVYSPSFV